MRSAFIASLRTRNTRDLIARTAVACLAITAAISACTNEPQPSPTAHLPTTPNPTVTQAPAPDPITKRILNPTPTPTATYTPTVTPTSTKTAEPTSLPTQTPTSLPTPTSSPTPTTTPSPINTPTYTPTSVPAQTPTTSPTPTSWPTQQPVLIDPEVITGGYDIGDESLWRDVFPKILTEDEQSCVVHAFEPDVEAFLDRRLFPDAPDDRDVQALGCLAPETFANIYLSIFMTLLFLTDDHVECLRGLFSVTDFSVIIASILPGGYDADYVDAFFDDFLDCVPEEVLAEERDDPTPTPTSTPTPTPTSTPTATPTTELILPTPAQPPPSCDLVVPDQANNPGLVRDCKALLTLKDTLQGTATLNWSADTPISDWEGVWVQGSPKRVTGLILTSKNLTGTIPPDLGRLDALEHLRLDDNKLTGEIPAELGNLRGLRTLLLNDNQLTSEVPTEMGNLDNLWHVTLADNQLIGCIPIALSNVFTSDSWGTRSYQWLPDCDPFNDGPMVTTRRDRYTGHDCLDDYDISFVGGGTWWVSPGPELGSGVLEQRALENDLVVLAQVLRVNPEVVTIDSVKPKLLRPSNYEDFERTLIVEVHLRVREYLKGDGPDEITVVVEGQSVFNTEEEGVCATAAFEHVHGQFIESQEGIAFLKSTDDSGSHNLGYADEVTEGSRNGHSSWLALDRERVYNATRNEWIRLDEAKHRITSVVEEYDRRDNQRWQNCVSYKYWSKGRDPWRYRGIPWGHEWYRDHDIIFNGERVPVRADETVWSYRDSNGYRSEFRFWLSGRDADMFKVEYHSEFERIANEWDAVSDGFGHRLAIWYIDPQPYFEHWQQTVSGYTIKAVQDLPEGEYQFYLHAEDQSEDFVDCGQAHPEPNRFRIIVDANRLTVPPAPTNVMILDDPEGWTIVWDPIDGVDDYYVFVYRVAEDRANYGAYVGEDTEDPGYRIKFDELNGCDDLIYVRITPEGDGEIYLRDFGVSAEPIELRTEPCEP